jgi:hypothetical protein
MKHITRIGFSVSSQAERTPAVVQVASSLASERGRMSVASSGYPESLGQTLHLIPLALPKGRGESKQNADARL